MVAKTTHRACFLIAYLAFCGGVSWSVNPQVVGSSPTGGAKDGCESNRLFCIKKTTALPVVMIAS